HDWPVSTLTGIGSFNGLAKETLMTVSSARARGAIANVINAAASSPVTVTSLTVEERVFIFLDSFNREPGPGGRPRGLMGTRRCVSCRPRKFRPLRVGSGAAQATQAEVHY